MSSSAAARIVLAVCILVTAVSDAAGDLPDISTIRLSGGSRLHFQRDPSSAATVVILASRGGRSAVPAGMDGLAHLVGRLAVDIPDDGKARELMSQATRISVSVMEDATLIKIECLSKYLDAALKTTAGIIQNPLFTPVRIDRIKTQTAPLSLRQEDNSAVLAHRTFLSEFFGGRGYGGLGYGNDLTLKTLGRKQIAEFYQSRYAAENVFFTAISDLSEQEMTTLLEKYFDRLPNRPGGPFPEPDDPRKPAGEEVWIEKDSQQTYIGYGYPLKGMSRRTYALAALCETLLGKGPGSRLWPLRVRDKLAYSVDAVATATRSGGALIAFVESESSAAGTAATALQDVLKRLRTEPLPAWEFEAARTSAAAFFLRSNETKEARATTLAVFESLGLGAGFFQDFPGELAALSLEDAEVFLRNLLNPGMQLRVTIGPSGREN